MKLSNPIHWRRSEASEPEHTSSWVGKHEGYDNTPLPRLTWKGFWMGILVSMGGFIFGYDTGQISGFLEMKDFLKRFGQHRPNGTPYFSNVRSGLIVGLLSIGTLFGALIAAPIADKIGRKKSIMFWCGIFSVGIIVQIAATDKWYQIMMGRFVAGLGVGALSLIVPMYQAETAPRHIRGALISTYQLMITFGIFLAAVFNYAAERHQSGKAASWQITLGLSFVPAVILCVGILGFSETPRYNYRNGKIDKATATMAKVYGVPTNHYSIQLELEEMRTKLAAESTIGTPLQEWIGMWKAPKMAYRLAIGIALQMFQQLTGANYFFYYGTTVFAGTGIKNSYVTQMILNGINFGVTFYGLYIVEHYGRRKSLIAGSVWMFICFLIFASVGHFALDRVNPENTEKAATAMICFACFFIFGFATTWGPICWTICGELYPSRYRAKAMALSTASNWLWNFLLAFFTPFITKAIDFRYGYVFAGTNVLGGLIVYFFVMEGKGRTLEEIDTMYLMGVKPWESATWEVPDLEEMSGKMRQRLEAGNPELAIKKEMAGDDGIAQGGTTEVYGKDSALEHERERDLSDDNVSETSEPQAGVKRIEAISQAWTKTSLIIAYVTLLLIANVTSLEGQVTGLMEPFATSSFRMHSLMSTIAVVQNVVSGDAQIFYSAGSNGLQMLQQIFVADTTDLLNRALFSSLFDLPFLWTTWAGPEIVAFYMSVFPYFFSYLQIVQGRSIVTSGYITRVFTFSSTVSSIVVSLIIKYTAHYKYYITFGGVIYLMGMGLMLHYRTENATTATLVGTQICIGIGGGFLNVPAQLAVQAAASHQQVAAVTTVWLTILQVGGAVGSAISGAIWSTYIPSKLQLYLPPDQTGLYSTIYGSILISANYTLYPAGSPVRIAINRAYQETMRYLLIGALCCSTPILPLTFFLHNYKLDEIDQKVTGRVIGNAEKRETRRSWRFWKR
ncbi:siderophore iron transporter mirC [Cucurbitaria berberidis CBS 394.84]|uniref:Siderophore iron transporter mirC n=1 Tax=Cucurbitaria berberidis CBS 394.84 TaxID=1168544 RepID=A0A9P4GQ33_9PLEO|nr:siderophore iron transporter mirC [Cucurbitaria berberidis CBS 394.84]KAF1849252.1 siderophore iron transporter mirC [Cucurbitaria berberidis CBS 394.84]